MGSGNRLGQVGLCGVVCMLAMVGHSGHGFIGIILGHFGQVDISLCLDCFCFF